MFLDVLFRDRNIDIVHRNAILVLDDTAASDLTAVDSHFVDRWSDEEAVVEVGMIQELFGFIHVLTLVVSQLEESFFSFAGTFVAWAPSGIVELDRVGFYFFTSLDCCDIRIVGSRSLIDG